MTRACPKYCVGSFSLPSMSVKATVVTILTILATVQFIYWKSVFNFAVGPLAVGYDQTIIYVITPTYWRLTQMADLTRMAQTLAHVKNLHWILVEDAEEPSPALGLLATRLGIRHTILATLTPKQAKGKTRGGAQRNAGLQWIQREDISKGVIYFGDDDNAYDVRLFEEIRDTRMVSVFPVGLISGTGVSSPVVKDGRIISFHDPVPGRKFPLDMAGFAVSIQLPTVHKANFSHLERPASLETSFLEMLNVTRADLEPKANNCSQIYVWHTKTVNINAKKPWKHPHYNGSNLPYLEELFNQGFLGEMLNSS